LNFFLADLQKIEIMKKNKIKVVGLFSGCGGFILPLALVMILFG
jgi:hypothetical protein